MLNFNFGAQPLRRADDFLPGGGYQDDQDRAERDLQYR